MCRLLCAAFVMFDTNLSQTDSKSFHTKQAGHIWWKFFMSAVVNKLTYWMVTLVGFLLTIFTKFRQLKTNLQALCCLTERIKKGKPTIKVTAEVFSRGLPRAPAEPWTEAPAGATGVPRPAARAGWAHSVRHRARSPGGTQQPETSPAQGSCGAAEGQEQHSREAARTPSHLHRSCNGAPARRSWAASATPRLSFEKNHCTQENVHRKIRKGRKNKLTFCTVISRWKSDIYLDRGKQSYKD